MSTSPASAHKHPHFDDRGAHEWFTTFAEAQAAARASRRHLFIEIGREL